MSKKYEFTGETCEHNGHTLKRIKRCSDNCIGGWIEGEENLSQEGGCFVYGEAKVYGRAHISENATASSRSEVYGSALVSGNALIYNNAQVYDTAIVKDKAIIKARAQVYGNALVVGGLIDCNSKVCGSAMIKDKAHIDNNAKIFGNVIIEDDAYIKDSVEVGGSLVVRGETVLCGDLVAMKTGDYIHLSGLRYPVTIQKNGLATIGCTTKTVKEWLNYSYKFAWTHMHCEEYEMMKRILTPLLEQYNEV